jgi:hypothetical protein
MSARAEKKLIMLKLVDRTPVLAGCSGCNLKFFVPKGLMKDPFQANNYLSSKFDRHVCTGEDPPPKTRINSATNEFLFRQAQPSPDVVSG